MGGSGPTRLGVAATLALAGLLACAPQAPPGPPESPEQPVADALERDWPATELREGGRISAELPREDAVHRWKLPLEAGDFLRVVVEQNGVDVELTWLDPSGEVVLSADRYIDDRGPELVMAVAEAPGRHTLSIEALPLFGGGRYEATIEAWRPAEETDRLASRAYLRFRQAEKLSDPEARRKTWEEVLDVWRELDEPTLEGDVLFRWAFDHYDHGEKLEALERFRKAEEALTRAGRRGWAALSRFNFAANLWNLGEPEAAERAVEEYRSLRAVAQELEDPLLEGKVLNGLGIAYRRWGEIQKSLTHYEEALVVLPEADVTTRPYVLHNLGVLHSLYFHDYARAADLLAAARDAWSAVLPTHGRWKAISIHQLGRLALEQGRFQDARRHFESSLAMLENRAPCDRAVLLGRLAQVEHAAGRGREADHRRDQALRLVDPGSCSREQPTVYILAAELAEMRGHAVAAVRAYETARRIAESLGDPTLLANSLAGVARNRRARGNLPEALEASRRAVELARSVRPTVLREDLRTAFFATVQDRFDLHIGILAELERHREAWAAAEAARAQALRDLLIEAGAGLRQAAAPELVEREKRLRRRLGYAEWEELDRAIIDRLVEELQRVRAEIRRTSPRYAELTRPRSITVEDVQRELLDGGTLLLEYRLGEEESWLWAISRDAFSAHRLPSRTQIESLAREAAGWLESLEWPGENPPQLCELSRAILGPVAAEVGGRRLALVPDGVLESVSFAALPEPTWGSCGQAPPLVADHEVVYLPSAGTLAAQRRRLADRHPGSEGVAVVADPVYAPEDPRLDTRPTDATTPRLKRLPYSGREAEAIRELAPEQVHVVEGFDASKEAVLRGSLSGHRVLHFAVHGVLHPDQPLLSHLSLSRFTRSGEPLEGSLHAHEIYDLDLPADLAVLSACDTARGEWMPGEGMVAGLPRAFLYAGSARVLISLWAVPDRSTKQLMQAFYLRLLKQGQSPSQALQEAQRELWSAGHPPWRWAGFTLQGDWQPLAPFRR